MPAYRDTDPGAWYLEHLSERDLTLLVQATRLAAKEDDRDHGQSPDIALSGDAYGDIDASALTAKPELVEKLLAAPATFRLVFEPQTGAISDTAGTSAQGPSSADLMTGASPFLVFATAVHRLLAELKEARHVREFAGARRRVVMLGTQDLVDVLMRPWVRLYLAELLASFTHISSGSILVRTRRGLRRQRFSELDPVRLAGLLEVLPRQEHAGVYRRLGDVALFLTGVFPDHTATRGLSDIESDRLLRSTRPAEGHGTNRLLNTAATSALTSHEDASAQGATSRDASSLLGTEGAVGLLEELGSRWYRLAAGSIGGPMVGTARALEELAELFGPARRALNVLTDRYLYPRREELFGRAS